MSPGEEGHHPRHRSEAPEAIKKLEKNHTKAINGMRRSLAKAKGENALLRERGNKIISLFGELLRAQRVYLLLLNQNPKTAASVVAHGRDLGSAHADMMKVWDELKVLGVEPGRDNL